MILIDSCKLKKKINESWENWKKNKEKNKIIVSC